MTDQRHTDVPQLFHYTCQHRADAVLTAGALLPAARLLPPRSLRQLRSIDPAVGWAAQVVWMTTEPDITPATADSCGITSVLGTCDRTEVRFDVLPGQLVMPWPVVRKEWPRLIVAQLEAIDGARPGTWWVSGGRVRVATPSLVRG